MNLKQFVKTATVFLTGNVLSKLVSFFLLPLYTSRLSPEQYGSYDIVLSLINLIAPIAFLQIWDGFFRFAFDYQKNEDKQKAINNGTFIFFCGIIFYISLFLAASAYFAFEYTIYALLYGLFFALQYIYTFAARVYLKNRLFAISGVINTLVTAILNVILILVYEWGIESLYVSSIAGIVVQIVIIEASVGVIRRFKISHINKSLIMKMIRFSIPLCIATISYWLLSGYTKTLVYEELGTYANGLYAVANKFASMITIAVTVFQYAWNEMSYMMANDQDRANNCNICIDIMLKGTLWGTAIICLIVKIVFPYLIDVQYGDALELIPACIIGVAFNSLAGFLGTLFMTEKKTGFILTSTLVSAALNIVVGYISCMLWGLQGAVISLAIAFFLLFALRIIKLVISYNIRVELNNIVHLAVLVISIIGFALLDSYYLFIASGLLCLLFGVYVYYYMQCLLNGRKKPKL